MNYYRQTIAEAFKAVLIDKTAAEQRVYTKMTRAINPSETPAILIYATDAKRGDVDMGNSVVPRVVTVTIEGAASSTPDAALDLADSLADAIEAIIEANPTLGNVVQECRWQRTTTDATRLDQHTLGVFLLQFEVDMLTESRQPYPFADDGIERMPHTVYTLPDTEGAELFDPVTPSTPAPCGPDGCAPPAWGGEVFKDGSLIP